VVNYLIFRDKVPEFSPRSPLAKALFDGKKVYKVLSNKVFIFIQQTLSRGRAFENPLPIRDLRFYRAIFKAGILFPRKSLTPTSSRLRQAFKSQSISNPVD
jgi:hypothetical protein